MTSSDGIHFRQIGRDRFDAFVGFSRSPEVTQIATEVAWFESPSGDVFAALVFDTDAEFCGIVFTADLNERFRWSTQTSFHDTPEAALAELDHMVGETLARLDEMRIQGDESKRSVDFFAPIVPEARRHPNFERLRIDPTQEAARELITVMMRWYEDRDGNFIQQFQSDGFDPRMWELYLWAMLVSLGYAVSFPNPAPDIVARFLDVSFAIEATTVNPSVVDGKIATVPVPDGSKRLDYFRHYLPIRYAGPLMMKLGKRYWEAPQVAGMPFVLAIQDFHAEMSMTYSGRALASYLYGLDLVTAAVEGSNPEQIAVHKWDAKIVPSSFFALPDSEHVSAVLFNASGTISKFNRIGLKVGFAPNSNVRVVHRAVRATFNGEDFDYIASAQHVGVDYPEDWIDGLEVYHNPNALIRLDKDLLPGAAHHALNEEGRLVSELPDGHLERSETILLTIRSEDTSDSV